MKRRPPKGNSRRVRHIDGNNRTTFYNRSKRIIQCESHQEYRLCVLLDRDPTVEDFSSQPTALEYKSANGKSRKYTPDFIVWRKDGSVEIHEVTVAERRRTKQSIQEREAAARQLCDQRGWTYVVHTDETLPNGTPWANLDNLVYFRAKAYFQPGIAQDIQQYLRAHGRAKLSHLVSKLADTTDHTKGEINQTLQHLVWHGVVQTDFNVLMYIESSPNRQAEVWIGLNDHAK